MKIYAQVKTGAKVEKVEVVDKTFYRVWVKARPIDGAANDAVCRSLAAHFGVAASQVAIRVGHRSPIKIVEVSV